MWTARDACATRNRPILDVAGRLWLEGRHGPRARSAGPLRPEDDVLRARTDHRPARGTDGGDPSSAATRSRITATATLDPEPHARRGARGDGARAFQSIKRVSGRAPRGWRSPAAEISPITMPMLVEYGFDYSSNFFDDDSPYLHTVGGQARRRSSNCPSAGCSMTPPSSSIRSCCPAAPCRRRRPCSRPGRASSTCSTPRTA